MIDHRNFRVEIARISTQLEIQRTRAPLIGDSTRALHFGSPAITPDPRPSCKETSKRALQKIAESEEIGAQTASELYRQREVLER